MTFFCINCLAELRAGDERCPRCGVSQSLDLRDYVTKLRAALAHPLAETRRRVIFILGERGEVDATGDLIRVVESDPDPYEAAEAVAALAKIGSADAIAAIRRAARHNSLVVRKHATEALLTGRDRLARGVEKVVRESSNSDGGCAESSGARKSER
jgi:HEAT repeat protein